MTKLAPIFFPFLFAATFLSAQIPPPPPPAVSHFKFEKLTLENGLAQNSCHTMIQDSKGFMWFGTEDGLHKFDGYKFTIYQFDPYDRYSLSNNAIRFIYEDVVSNGRYLWIGTNGGGLNKLDRFTGKFFRYQHVPGDSQSLSSDYLLCILQDDLGHLWIGTDGGGLNKMDPQTGKFTHYLNSPGNRNTGANRIHAILADYNGMFWIGTGGGLYRFDRQTDHFTHHQIKINNRNIGASEIWTICQDRAQRIWFGTVEAGIFRIVPDSSGSLLNPEFINYQNNPNDPFSLSHNYVTRILEPSDETGFLWIGTNGGGLNEFNTSTGQFIRCLHNPLDHNSLSNNLIWTVYESPSQPGILWIGTETGGINKLDKYKGKFVHYWDNPQDPDDLNDNSIWSFCEDRKGELWIGTRTGGINRLNRDTGKYTYYQNQPANPTSLSANHVRCIYEDHNGKMWIGSDGGGLNRLDPETGKFTHYFHNPNDPYSLGGNRVYSIHEDALGIIWVGTATGGLSKYYPGKDKFLNSQYDPDNPNSLTDNFVYKIYEDRSGNIWLGTFTGGLEKLISPRNKKQLAFKHYRHNPDDPASISCNTILSIYEDRSGTLWLGTFGGGLNRLDKTADTFRRYVKRDGLASDVVYGILEDDFGNLWLSTNNGISKFDPKSETFKNYDVSDGLQSREYNGGAYLKCQNGEMLFGGINGFNGFFPEFVKNNPFIPPVYITDFQILNDSGPPKLLPDSLAKIDILKLSHNQNMFSFEFAALNFTNPEKNRYKYILKGFDKTWIDVDANNRVVQYMNLQPGAYLFAVKASNNDGIWNDKEVSLQIAIGPPFWGTLWFRILAITAILALVYVIYRRRLKNVRIRTELQSAHDAQMSIMPQSDPNIPGIDISGICLPAHEVGGDFFDYILMNEQNTKLGIVIGDVSGKAMSSAMTAVMCSGMINSRACNDSSVSETMTHLNRIVARKTDKKVFTALCLAVLDAKDKKLSFTNGGLNYPLLKSRHVVFEIEGVGSRLPLGAVQETAYQERTISLHTGDVVIFFTDGVTEAENRARQRYDVDRLKSFLKGIDTVALKASEIKNRIIADIKEFSGNAHQYDDMTIVVVKTL